MGFKWRHQYDDKADAVERDRTAIECKDPSLTQQQFAEDADLNVLARRFGIRDADPPVPAPDPSYYGDVSEAPDLRTVLENVKAAQERFMALPAQLRARFHNDPAVLHDFVSREENRAEAVALGLLEEPAAPRRRSSDPVPRRRREDADQAAADRRELEEYRAGRRQVPPPVAKPS